jgi:hypothetical protein
MAIKYAGIGLNIKKDYLSYQITNDENEDIGTIEGSGNKYGEFLSVIKVYNPKFQKKGLGFQFFKKAFDEIDANYPISLIKGSWHKGGEFQDFEDGMSTNLKIYLENLKTMSQIDSAFSTPTGKWVKKLGFNQCNIITNSTDEVVVEFTK